MTKPVNSQTKNLIIIQTKGLCNILLVNIRLILPAFNKVDLSIRLYY